MNYVAVYKLCTRSKNISPYNVTIEQLTLSQCILFPLVSLNFNFKVLLFNTKYKKFVSSQNPY